MGVYYLGAPVTADVPRIIDDGRQTKDLFKDKFKKISIKRISLEKRREI